MNHAGITSVIIILMWLYQYKQYRDIDSKYQNLSVWRGASEHELFCTFCSPRAERVNSSGVTGRHRKIIKNLQGQQQPRPFLHHGRASPLMRLPNAGPVLCQRLWRWHSTGSTLVQYLMSRGMWDVGHPFPLSDLDGVGEAQGRWRTVTIYDAFSGKRRILKRWSNSSHWRSSVQPLFVVFSCITVDEGTVFTNYVHFVSRSWRLTVYLCKDTRTHGV